MTNSVEKPGAVLIRAATVIDGTGASPRPASSLLVSGGTIEAVGTAAEVRAREYAPGTVRTVDASGLTLMPGLIDAHCHISLGNVDTREQLYFYTSPEYGAIRASYNARKILRAGVTTVSEPLSVWNIGVAVRDAVAAGLVEGPRIITAGRALTTLSGTGFPNRLDRPGVLSALVAVGSSTDGVKEIRLQVNDGVDLIKILASTGGTGGRSYGSGEVQTFTRSELQVMVDEAHWLGRKVAAHARSGASAADAARAGVDWIFHCSFIDESEVEVIHKEGRTICPTMTLLANAAEWGPRFGVSSSFSELCKRELDATAGVLTEAHRAGVPMLVGSEAGFSITPHGEWHAREIELFVTHLGFTPLEAVTCATGGNAKNLGLGDVTGTLQTGRAADLLLVDGDPLKDVRILQDRARFRIIMKDGAVVDAETSTSEPRRWAHEYIHKLSSSPMTYDAVHGVPR
jgi:imidazolonepropionase-like amidohydrolase